ncbi:MAG TPA: hypothetical protein VH183_06155 [Burkholderiaceae bacterium]|nr:hypothetical protein [Burkholderiaceae bacterium]
MGDTAHMGGSSLGLTRAPAGSFPLLERLVALTVRAERFLARCAEAEAHAGCGPFEGSDRFINDAAGGAFRSAEAARSLRAQGG